MTAAQTGYIIDWDLPKNKPSARVQFHRELKRLYKKYNLEETRSTQSVLKTSNEALAWEVHELAKKYGHSNIYQATALNGSVIP
jgi:hypothetical protein